MILPVPEPPAFPPIENNEKKEKGEKDMQKYIQELVEHPSIGTSQYLKTFFGFKESKEEVYSLIIYLFIYLVIY